jgi:hypothetical protein
METMMRKTVLLLLLCFSLVPQVRAERELAVTVYNQDFAVVKDTREFELSAGDGKMSFTDVAAKIDPTSVQATSPTRPGFSVLEQNFEYNLVSSAKLMKKMIDQPVSVLLEDGQSFSGKLLAAETDAVTLQTGEEVKIIQRDDHFYQLVLPKLPPGLLLRPTLVWQVTNPEAGKEQIEIAYQTAGFNWLADYNVLLNPAKKTLDLNGWVSITNTSGASYPDAHLKLVAGEVHKVKEEPQMEMDLGVNLARAKMAAAPPPGFEERAFAEYHLYDLGRKTTLKDNETKQIEFVNVRNVAYTTEYLFDPSRVRPWGPRYTPDTGEEDFQNLKLVATIENKKENKLGIPLPAGNVRMYQRDTQQADHLIGQDAIDHTPKDEKVRLTVGEAFDVDGSRKILSQERPDNNTIVMDIQIRIRNHKDSDVPVVVRDQLMGHMNWTIENPNVPYEKKDFQTIEFKLTVPANSEQDIRYKVRYEQYLW